MLRRVALKEIVSWPFKNLTHLWLGYQDPDSRLPIDAFLALLLQSPNLEYLGLVNAGPLVFGMPLPNAARFPFPRLRFVELGSLERPDYVLAHLELPVPCTVHVWNERLFHPLIETPALTTIHPIGIPTTAVFRVSRGLESLTQDMSVLFIGFDTTLKNTLSRCNALLSQVTDVYLEGTHVDAVSWLLDSLPNVERIWFVLPVNYLAIISKLETTEEGAHLERVIVKPMSLGTRLTKDERMRVKEIEEVGWVKVGRPGTLQECVVEVRKGVVVTPINPVLRRPMLEAVL